MLIKGRSRVDWSTRNARRKSEDIAPSNSCRSVCLSVYVSVNNSCRFVCLSVHLTNMCGHSGILARNTPSDEEDMKKQGFQYIRCHTHAYPVCLCHVCMHGVLLYCRLVICNLYPFAEITSKDGTLADAVENIDIGKYIYYLIYYIKLFIS